MYDPNKKVNLVLGVLTLLFIVASIVMWYLVFRREATRNYFNISNIKNITWINKDNSFSIKDNKVNLVIGDDINFTEKFKKFETDTGKLTCGDETIYIRSVSSSNLVLWYNKGEYHFNKYIEAK